MKKINWKFKFGTVDWRRSGRLVWWWLSRGVYLSLIRHSHILDVTVVALVLAWGVYLLVVQLWLDPGGELPPEPRQVKLEVERIQALQEWVDERQRTRESGLVLPDNNVWQ